MNEDHGFLEDENPAQVLHAKTLRSPVARGRLLSIEVPRLPRGCTLIRAEDIPGKNSLDSVSSSLSILAKDALIYKGEPVALLVGSDAAQLEGLASECQVIAEEQMPHFNYEKFSSDQLAAKRTALIGNPDAAFKKAASILEGSYRTSRQEQWYAECQGALAMYSKEGLSIKVASQWPFHVRQAVARVLDLKPEEIVVLASEIGVHLDGKLWYPSLIAAQAALAAFICKKSVKLMLTREEDILYSPKRPSVLIYHRSALGAKGELLAMESRSVLDVGAAGPFAEETLDRLCLGSLGAYRCPNIRIEGFAVKTNTPPSGPFAGLGLSQAFFAMERHASRIADSCLIDPADWRQEHALGRNDMLASGSALKEAVPSFELIDTVQTMSDYRRKWASYELIRKLGKEERIKRGIGISFVYQGNGFLSYGADKGNYSVELTLEKDGSLEIKTSAVSGSRSAADLWRGVAAELLSLDDKQVRIAENRTDMVPDSGPSSLSRNIAIITKLIERCCVAIRKQRFRDPLPITIKRTYRAPKSVSWEGLKMEGNPFALFSWAASVVELEVDPLDYCAKVRGVYLAVDGGRILSESKARSSLEIASHHALSWASREMITKTPLAYDMAAPSEAPKVTIDFAWNDTLSSKGIGELPFACIPAAYAQALSQALDSSFDSLPILPIDIRNAVEGL